MITQESLKQLSLKYQSDVFPHIIREYIQNLFLSEMYRIPEANKLLFKGGTALRIIYNSPRFSEDLDFSLFGTLPRQAKLFMEGLFVHVLAQIEHAGIIVELGKKIGTTSGGYFGIASFCIFEYPPVNVEINISLRKSNRNNSEVDSIANDFVPTYTIVHLPQSELIEEKIFGALQQRKKPRDYYDLYFIMRKGLLSLEQKKRIAKIKDQIITESKNINFKSELGVFLPSSQQDIIRNFSATLSRELNRQIAENKL